MSQQDFINALCEIDSQELQTTTSSDLLTTNPQNVSGTLDFGEEFQIDIDLLWAESFQSAELQNETGTKRSHCEVNDDHSSKRLATSNNEADMAPTMSKSVSCGPRIDSTMESTSDVFRSSGQSDQGLPFPQTQTSERGGKLNGPDRKLSLKGKGPLTTPINQPPTMDLHNRVYVGGAAARDSQELPQNTPNDSADNFTIRHKKNIFRKKFNISEIIYELKLNQKYNDASWRANIHILMEGLEALFDRATQGVHEDDLVRVYLFQEGMDTPIVLNLRKRKDITVQSILDIIEKMLQSNESLKFNNTFEIHVGIINLLRGGSGAHITNIEDAKVKKKCIINVSNADHMCAARAVVIARAYLFNDPQKKRIAFNNKSLQTRLALELCEKAGLDYTRPCQLDDLELLERAADLQIIVVDANIANEIVYKGSSVRPNKIYLLYHNSHYDVITKMNTFYGRSYYCDVCFKAYQNKSAHRCSVKCGMCYSFNCEKTDQVSCDVCNRLFRNGECYRRHQAQNKNHVKKEIRYKSICQRFWACPLCKKLLNRAKRNPESHDCDEQYCATCSVYHTGDHICYMKPGEIKKPCEKLIFFDFETDQSTGEHIPNYVVAQRVCKSCLPIEDIRVECDKCKVREVLFQGADTLNLFGKWLIHDRHKDSVVIAHNLKGFDGYFILKYLINQTIVPQVIYAGGKIMSIYVKHLNLKILDSLNLIPMRLANFSKAFDLPVTKGEFPFGFNCLKNMDYIGILPPLRYYFIDSKSKEDRREFLAWYYERAETTEEFNFQHEMYRYCSIDVTLLRLGCLKFRQLVMQVTTPESLGKERDDITGLTGIDPFNYMTLASLCFAIFSQLYLKPNTIALLPESGMVVKNQYSMASIRWFEYLMYRAGIRGEKLYIQHALNDKEHVIGRYRLDGYDAVSKTAWEFASCMLHGCTKCYSKEVINPINGSTMGHLYSRTMDKKIKVEALGLKYVIIWYHEYEHMLKNDVDFKRFVHTLDIQPRLAVRDSLAGGRTDSPRLYLEAKEGTKIHYYDYTSLYPYVNLTANYVTKMPEVITRNFKDAREYKGFIKCKVLAPRKLYHPVLPMKCHDRLMFVLCRTCCEQLSQTLCKHSDEQRSFIGTFVSEELHKALDLNYKILKIYEVYHFPNTCQYNGKDSNTGLFSEYIKKFLKLKQQASGYPSHCVTESDKQEYVNSYLQHQRIQLDADAIEKNPGLRAVSKLFLNSLWGRMGIRSNMTQNTFLKTAADFYQLLTDTTKEVLDFHDITEEIVLVDWKYKREFTKSSASSNVFIASITTALARLKLYEVLEKLGRRVLYHDTDSVIFYTEAGQEEPATGVFLGELTSELDPEDYIVQFAAAGPKNYSYKTKFGHTVTKVRGFTLNAKNSEVINFDTVSDMVKNVLKECTCKGIGCSTCVKSVFNPRKITRKKQDIKIVNRPEKKDYRIKYIKRVIQPDLDTLPYGY